MKSSGSSFVYGSSFRKKEAYNKNVMNYCESKILNYIVEISWRVNPVLYNLLNFTWLYNVKVD